MYAYPPWIPAAGLAELRRCGTPRFDRYAINSIIVTADHGEPIIFGALRGYVFARLGSRSGSDLHRLPGDDDVPQVLVVPTFLIFNLFGWINGTPP